MTTRQVKFLLTVAEERSTDRAAQRLGVDRRELIEQLRALEAEVRAPVLQQTTTGLGLTPAGRAYLAQAVIKGGEGEPSGVAGANGQAEASLVATESPTVDVSPVETAEASGSPGPARRTVLMGAGAAGLVAAGAAALRWVPRASRPSLAPRAANGERRPPTTRTAPPAGKAPAETGGELIRAENARPGTPGWVLAAPDSNPRAIEGFADAAGAKHGESVRLFVRSRSSTFKVEVYRMGWYGGDKARLVWTSPEVGGGDQPAPKIDPTTKMVDCSHWKPSLSFTPDDTWMHGQYLLKLVQPDGNASYVPFVLRSPAARCEVLVIACVTTGAAYETWGGHSLYAGLSGGVAERADVVSLDRPFGSGYGGAGWLLGGTSEIAQLLESEGVDVAYATNVDQHGEPDVMTRCNAIVSGAHDEYYSLPMRLGLQSAVNTGVNVIYLGANAIYRRIRFEDSPLGANRRIVNYRSASRDPEKRPDLATTNWAEAPAALPESSLTANVYESNQSGAKAPLHIVDGDAWMFADTGLGSGSMVADGVREEWDRVRPGKPLPEQLQILAHSPFQARGKATISDMTYATLPSGAALFNSGTLRFQQRMGPLSPPGQGGDDGALRRLVWNLVAAFRTGPAESAHPAVPNVSAIYPG